MAFAWTVSTAPTGEPLTLAEAKAHLRVDIAEEDSEITILLAAARTYVETVLNRQLMLASYTWYLDEYPDSDEFIVAPRAPLIAVTSITYVDTDGASQTEASSVYTVDADNHPGRIYLAYDKTWSAVREIPKAITIISTHGYSSGAIAAQRAAVPVSIKAAILIVLADLHEHREMASEMQTYHNETVDRLLWSERIPEVA